MRYLEQVRCYSPLIIILRLRLPVTRFVSCCTCCIPCVHSTITGIPCTRLLHATWVELQKNIRKAKSRVYIVQRTNIMSSVATVESPSYAMLRIRSNMTGVCVRVVITRSYNLFNAFFLFAPAVSFALLFTALVVVFVAVFPAMLASAVPKGEG